MGGAEEVLNVEQRHGKAKVRVARVWRSADGHQFMVEWNVLVHLLSHCKEAYFGDDNSNIVATDSMKNTVYVKAKECSDIVSPEEFAILLGKHFTTTYSQVTDAIIKVVEKPWERIAIDGQAHKHGFKLGLEKHTAEVVVKKDGSIEVTSGIEGLALLKTTQSGFEAFVRDQFTLLKETRERLFATEINAQWRYSVLPDCFTMCHLDIKKILVDTFFGPPSKGVYSPSVQNTLYCMAQAVLSRFPQVESIHLKMPNLHFLPVNLPNMVQFDHDVYTPTDEPHGTIEATVSRKRVPLSKL